MSAEVPEASRTAATFPPCVHQPYFLLLSKLEWKHIYISDVKLCRTPKEKKINYVLV